MDPKKDQLIKIVGLDALPSGSPNRGVVMGWSVDVLSSLLKTAGVMGAALRGDTPLAEGPGAASWKWIWSTASSPNARLTLTVFVSSTGPAAARNRLVRITTENMLAFVPYVRGPADLGDTSALLQAVGATSAHVAWVFHNVCVSVRKDGDAGTDVLAVARAVQAALAQHLVEPLDAAVPKVDRLELSAPEVRVAEPLTVRIHLQGADPARRFLVALYDRPPDVRVRRASLDLEVTADNPGVKTLDIAIADASTLLSTSAQAKMVVKR